MREKVGLKMKRSSNRMNDRVFTKNRRNPSKPIRSPVEQILHLQRTIGNRAVTRLIQSGALQAKLKIDRVSRLTLRQPNDIYEKEADRVADRVMKMPEGSLVNGHWSLGRKEGEGSLVSSRSFLGRKEDETARPEPLAEQITPLIQRQAEEEEETAQAKLVQRQTEEEEEAQTMLQRQAEEEEEEEEAQTMIQRQAEEEEEEEEEPVQTMIQRQAEEEEEEGEAQTTIQRQAEKEEETAQAKAVPGNTPEVTPNIESRIKEMKGGGQPLSESTRAFFEPRFGADFSQVRVHTDSRAARTARSINAKAFTTGKDIVFNSGQYSPGTTSGKRLLAHELTHVIQQAQGVIPSKHEKQQTNNDIDDGVRIPVFPKAMSNMNMIERKINIQKDHTIGLYTKPRKKSNVIRPLPTNRFNNVLQLTPYKLPRPIKLCGKNLTLIEVLPLRPRPLQPCLPPSVMVYRVNIVGRDLTIPTTGKGSQVFNLHIGYYRHPTSGRLCVIADDSKRCIIPRCQEYGCFPKLSEVIDKIFEIIKLFLKVIGIALLLIILVLIGRWLIRIPIRPVPGGAPVIATGDKEKSKEEA